MRRQEEPLCPTPPTLALTENKCEAVSKVTRRHSERMLGEQTCHFAAASSRAARHRKSRSLQISPERLVSDPVGGRWAAGSNKFGVRCLSLDKHRSVCLWVCVVRVSHLAAGSHSPKMSSLHPNIVPMPRLPFEGQSFLL